VTILSISPSVKQHQIRVVSQRLFASEAYKTARTICVFLSMPGEFDTRSIVEDIFRTNRKCYVPRVESTVDMKMLQAFSLEDIAHFPLNKYSIPEPPGASANRTELESSSTRDDAMQSLDIDLFLVPGVAFDSECHRLGHGKGYYDRYLNEMELRLRNRGRQMPPLIGLAFSEQMVGSVPVEPHDRQLDDVLVILPTEELPEIDSGNGAVKRARLDAGPLLEPQ